MSLCGFGPSRTSKSEWDGYSLEISTEKKDTRVTFGGLCICEHLRCFSDNHIFRLLFFYFFLR